MSDTTLDPSTQDLYPEDVAVLNAMVTYAMENVPGLQKGPAERRVAQVIGRWALGSNARLLPERPRSDNPGAAALTRDDAITRLCGRMTSLVDRELMREDNSFLVREDVREEIDDYIIDAAKRKARLKSTPGIDVDPVTTIVHLDGGIDALQEIRFNLFGERLSRDGIDIEAALR